MMSSRIDASITIPPSLDTSESKSTHSYSYLSNISAFIGNTTHLKRLLCVLLAVTAILCCFVILSENNFVLENRDFGIFPVRWERHKDQHIATQIHKSSKRLKATETIYRQQPDVKSFDKSKNVTSVKFTKSKLITPKLNPSPTDFTKATLARNTSIFVSSLSSTSKTSLNALVIDIVTSTKLPTHFITINFQGRLGNLLFQYASLYGIAKKNNLIPAISGSLELNKYFHLTSSKNSNLHHFEKNYGEKKGCTFEPEVMKIGQNNNFRLNGYFQSWKYFKNVENLLRKELNFNTDITKKATEQFSAITSNVKSSISGEVTFIAVHVRRGDMASKKVFIDYGYVSADAEYLNRAIEYMKSKISKPVFIMASDDLPWCKKNFVSEDIIFVKPGNSPVLDMAILTKCQYAIITVGSYGWWVAWLINGTTVYYKDYPRPGTKLANLFKSDDYRPPNWIGL